MKSIRWMNLAMAAGLLAYWSPNSPGQAPSEKPRVVWEYKTLSSPKLADNDEMLNKLGQQGWELVLVAPSASSPGSQGWVFKRAKPSPPSSSLQAGLVRQGYRQVKLISMHSGYVAVKAKINGKELTLVIDTGAPRTYLDRKRTDHLGLDWSQPVNDAKRVDAPRPTSQTTVEVIELTNATLLDSAVFDYDLNDINNRVSIYGDPPFDGIIGSDLLKRHRAIIDYKTKSIFVFDSEQVEQNSEIVP